MRNLASGLVAVIVTVLGITGAPAQTPSAVPAPSPAAPQAYDPEGRPEVPNYATSAGQAPGSLRGDLRVPDLRYWACDGVNFLPRYTARWQGDGFILSRIDGGDTRSEQAINFVDWNMKCWTATWDAKQKLFVIKRLPQEEDEHTDDSLHFLAHDLTPWQGFRDAQGTGWIVRPGRFEIPGVPTANAIDPRYAPTTAYPPYLGY